MTPRGVSAAEDEVWVRRAIPEDAEVLGSLFAREARYHRDLTRTFELEERFDWRAMAAGLIVGRDSRIVVAEGDGQVVGFAYGRLLGGGLEPRRPRAGRLRGVARRLLGTAETPSVGPVRPARRGIVEDCWVEPEHRRRGLARQLFEELTIWMASRGISRVELSVVAANEGAVALWQELGFEPFRLVLQKSLV